MRPVEATSQNLRRFLQRHRIATLNIAGVLDHEPRAQAFVDDEADPRGVLVKGPWYWYVHTEDEAFLEMLCKEMLREDRFYRFSGVWRPVAEGIQARLHLVWESRCDLYVLPEGRSRPPGEQARVTSVDLKDAEIIDEHYAYRNDHSLDKIRGCIRNRPSSAVCLDGHIVCWLLVHEDDSLGIMYTLEEHRRQGYALDVSLNLVAKQLAAGRTPFLQILDDNSLSPGLARRCGFESQGPCDWFGVMTGIPPELIEGGSRFRKQVLESLATEDGLVPCTESGVTCLCRFLVRLPQAAAEENPVVEIPAEEWLVFATRHFENLPLKLAIDRLGKNLRLLGKRREGVLQAGAALLIGSYDCFELLWYSRLEPCFLLRVLEQGKALGLDTAFVHPEEQEVEAFRGLGFFPVRAGMA
jgi:hypothetical protein